MALVPRVLSDFFYFPESLNTKDIPTSWGFGSERLGKFSIPLTSRPQPTPRSKDFFKVLLEYVKSGPFLKIQAKPLDHIHVVHGSALVH